MATKEFILQGFTKRTHANAVREMFDVADIKSVFISIAFVSESGVEQIETQLAAHAAHVSVLAGIRNDITSYQGLLRLHKIAGLSLFAFDTGSRTVVFHPKLFLVRGKERARVIIGSANLTLGGLNNNIEAGMMFNFDMTDEADKTIVNGIEAQFNKLPADYPDHIFEIKKQAVLDEMLSSGRLADEMALPPPRPTRATGDGKTDTVPRIKLAVPPLRRALKKAKAAAKPVAPKAGAASASVGVEYELVWESKPLTRRDLTIPNAAGTHATGSVNLDKGLLPEAVDHRHYFRDEIFGTLAWSPSTKTTEEAFAKFHLIIKGVSRGEFDLRIGHTTGTTSKGYLQNNAMTRLSWGPMRVDIARPELIDRTLALYRDKVDPTRFILEID